ncbi:MAG: hypothetical protein AAGF83_01250 [Cyanobacteria bacterium P01_G01_bin.67]
MRIFRASSLWLFSFTLMFFLALDFWSWEQPIALSWLNLPAWVFYFVCLQITLAIAMSIFALTFWQSASDEEK